MPVIALIDDDADIVENNRILLEANGYTVVSAHCVDDAVELVERAPPDLIILDVMMQEADDGYYLANRWRKSGYTFPIIMLTSISKSIGFRFGDSALAPIEEFLEKPVDPEVLLAKIDHHLTQSTSRASQ